MPMRLHSQYGFMFIFYIAMITGCLNQDYCCIAWASLGYCTRPNLRSYMRKNCQPSCDVCNGVPGTRLWDTDDEAPPFSLKSGLEAEEYTCFVIAYTAQVPPLVAFDSFPRTHRLRALQRFFVLLRLLLDEFIPKMSCSAGRDDSSWAHHANLGRGVRSTNLLLASLYH
ncbi:hypothetical protein KIN20_023542 [Parelaphostrongylus tenuis]|uniref:ShKT domain-containing protein n=1 Tax=Parelaphostrongylus tenuis TaxID=148309 RepID=A0AAD5NC96_PARTN|nr:hypothetical protein KIN20_023542 [Parelaphostrongylus tenuis]